MDRVNVYRRCCAGLAAGMIALAVLVPQAARAGLSGCTIQSAQLMGPEHEQIIAVAPGTFEIGDFVGSDRFFEVIFRCKSEGNSYKWGKYQNSVATVYSAGIPDVGWNDVDKVPVFTTAQLQPRGLGVAGYYYLTNYETGSQNFNNSDEGHALDLDPPSPSHLDGQGYFYPTMIFRYRLVKINDNLDTLLDNITTIHPLAFPVAAIGVIDNEYNTSPVATATVYMPTLTLVQRACTPFVQTVSFPDIDESELLNIGDSGQEMDFRITIRCPHNAARFGYYVEGAHGYEDETQGIIKIDPASTAKGICLRITTLWQSALSYPKPNFVGNIYIPIKFGTMNRYGYADVNYVNVVGDPMIDESDYIFPVNGKTLKVAVYRTGNLLVSGSYTAALKFYVTYR